MSTAENKDLVRRYIEDVWCKGNIAALEEYCDPDGLVHVPGSPAPLRGLESSKQMYASFRTAMPDLTDTIDDLVAEGDRVAIRYTLRGTHHGPFIGPVGSLPPTGKPITVTGINVVRIAGGKMVEGWAQMDMLGLLQQLGAIPAPAEATH